MDMGTGQLILVVLLVVGLLALLLRPMVSPPHFTDKDADGEPDEPDGPAAGL